MKSALSTPLLRAPIPPACPHPSCLFPSLLLIPIPPSAPCPHDTQQHQHQNCLLLPFICCLTFMHWYKGQGRFPFLKTLMGPRGLAIKRKVRNKGRRKKPTPSSCSLSSPFVPQVANCSEPPRPPPVPPALCGQWDPAAAQTFWLWVCVPAWL